MGQLEIAVGVGRPTLPATYDLGVVRASPHLRKIELDWSAVEDRDAYPYSVPAIHSITEISLPQAVTFLVGENGSGKSTLLEAAAVAAGLNPEGGTRNLSFATRNSHSALEQHLRLSWNSRPSNWFFLRAESFYNVATKYENLDPPLPARYHEYSHGEAFLEVLRNHFRGEGLFLLDEPESALSLLGQLQLLRIMHQLQQQRSQFLVATHSPILMALPGALILECSGSGLREIAYRDSEQYRLTRSFLEEPDDFLRHLFAD